MKIALIYSSSIEYMKYALVSSYAFFKSHKGISDINISIYIYTDCFDEKLIEEYQLLANKIGNIQIIKPKQNTRLSTLLDNLDTNGRWHKVVYRKYDMDVNQIQADYYIFSDVDQIYIKPIDKLLSGNSFKGEIYPIRLRTDVEHVFKSVLNNDELISFSNFTPVCTPGLIFNGTLYTEDFYNIFCNLLRRFIERNIYNDELCFNAALMLYKASVSTISNYNVPCTSDCADTAYAISSIGRRKFWNSVEISTLFPGWYNHCIEIDRLTDTKLFSSISVKPLDKAYLLRKEIMSSIWLKYIFNKSYLFGKSLFFIPKSPDTYKCRHRELAKETFQMQITLVPTSSEKIRSFSISGYINNNNDFMVKILNIVFTLSKVDDLYLFSFEDSNIEKLYYILEFISCSSYNINNIEVLNDR